MKPLYFISVLLMLGTLMSLSSCVSVEKAQRILDQNPEASTAYCADRFRPDTTTTIKRDTVEVVTEVPGPVLECPETIHPTTSMKYTPTVQCPASKLTTKTYTITKTITEINVAREQQLRQQLEKKTTENANLVEGRNTWRIVAVVGAFLVAGFVLLLFRR